MLCLPISLERLVFAQSAHYTNDTKDENTSVGIKDGSGGGSVKDIFLRNPPVRECDNGFRFNSSEADYRFAGEARDVPSMNITEDGRVTINIYNDLGQGSIDGSVYLPSNNGSGYAGFISKYVETTCISNEVTTKPNSTLSPANQFNSVSLEKINPPFKECFTGGNLTNAKYTILGSTVLPTTIPETPAGGTFDLTVYNNLITGKLDGTIILGQGVVVFDIDSISTSCKWTTLTQ